MKIYTKTGDAGETSLFGGKRVPKSHIRIDAYGTVDELNSYIGLLRDLEIDNHHKTFLINIQEELFVIGAFLATPEESETLKNGKSRLRLDVFGEKEVAVLEKEIDALDGQLEPMTHFILPGGNVVVSHCHIARTICRRAERICVLLQSEETVNVGILKYLNRLSDYLFVLARMLSKQLQVVETKWIPSKNK
ncbi:cob(I)yrinic acid a c-diamide adenosyltransferase [Wenyingzhuangia fucanilytica]|uniref:Corrinoid adenosyltransferase n=1 Tax=Wenyingzhuangia fucanilytica TaxID=1790137 RepID=A0A1B1Y4N8_9FLAO|nr:cob(I)yrinic acid a,c-diamide adenosyltransferase [Wenyingzhuangia fucanilytica]ANW95744.1 cob(I)yrinic acid a c-diamide adenosyltransferase [Wenyingzhuangia fucanilytica]